MKTYHLRLGRTRSELEREIRELRDRIAECLVRLDEALARHDYAMMQDISIELGPIETKIEEDAFILELMEVH